MSPDAKRIKKLLYVSDWSSNDVYVYDFKKGTLEGQLSGLNDPYGQCVDKKGNLWVVAFGGSSVSEYARGRTQTVKTLKTDYQPMGCSVDPTTGNLAVAALHAVDVFVHARGKAHVYQSAVCYPFWAPGYDDAGNLYVEALLYGSAEPLAGYSDPLACELPHGGTSLRAGRTRAGGNPTRSLQSPPERPVGQSVSIAPKARLRSRFPRKETVREMSRSSISKAAPCTCAPSAGLSPVKQFLVESVEGAAVDESGDSFGRLCPWEPHVPSTA
jgi:hypothetical protein